MKNKTVFLIVVLFLALDVLVWKTIIFVKSSDNLEIYFLSVGQGDSELAILPGGIKVLIDGGPNNKILDDLALILPPTDRYIDLVINSHPHPDHFIGLINVLKNYKVGAFIYNGRQGVADSWPVLIKSLKDKKISAVTLAAGDRICYRESCFNILSPTADFLKNKETNDSSLAMELSVAGAHALFTGDIGEKIENFLTKNYSLKIDILKVGHHGSKFSTSQKFLASILPRLAFIEVGKNSYGHPTKEVLARLASIGAQIYRTDTDGTIKIIVT